MGQGFAQNRNNHVHNRSTRFDTFRCLLFLRGVRSLIALHQSGRQHTLDFAEVLLRYLYENDGYCNLGDKSPAELIYDRFLVSKKAFKKAIGDLYKRRLITIEEDGNGIRLA